MIKNVNQPAELRDMLKPPAMNLRNMLTALAHDADAKAAYGRARKFRDITRHACNYDMTARCNLFCEGCFYFEGENQTQLKENTDLPQWERFFAQQAQNGGGYGYFAGAEPALAQDRLRIAAKYIKRGSISTNGTIRIDTSLPYTIMVSVWGDENETALFRGGGTFRKAVRNFAQDPRARFIYTVNRNNISSAGKVAHILYEEGARFSFNYYSPTVSYLRKIRTASGNDKRFFRLSSAEYHLHFTAEDLAKAQEEIGKIIEDYPDACLHTQALNDWMANNGARYTIDRKTGIATDCGGRNSEWHQAYGVDLKPLDAKCCTPNVDCSTCRLYAPALNTLLFRHEEFFGDEDRFRQWLRICDQWGRLFLTDDDSVWAG